MSRKGPATKRILDPDPVLDSRLVARFINKLIMGGKKSVAERIFYGALQEISEKHSTNPLDVFEQAIRNCMPQLEVRGRRVGGATYQVPMEVRADRQVSLSIRWIVDFARKKKGKPMAERLAEELVDAYNGTGQSVQWKENIHKMAEANKAYAHFAR